MRRVFSVVFFVLGAWMLSGEMTVAFFDLGEGDGLNFTVLALMLLFALPFLLAGAWISPGRRWRELGLTILITVGIVAFSGLSAVVMMFDPKLMRAMPPMPEIGLSPATGLLNLALVSAIGFWLYRGARSGEAAADTSP